MAMENKPGFKMENSANYDQNEELNQNNSYNERPGSRIYPDGGADNKMNIRQSYEGDE